MFLSTPHLGRRAQKKQIVGQNRENQDTCAIMITCHFMNYANQLLF